MLIIAPGPEKWGAQIMQDCQSLCPFTGMSCIIGVLLACVHACLFFSLEDVSYTGLSTVVDDVHSCYHPLHHLKMSRWVGGSNEQPGSSSHKDESDHGDLIRRLVRSMFFTQKGKSYRIFWNRQCDKVTNWKTHYSCFTQMHWLDKQRTAAPTSNHKFKVSISGLYLKNDRASSLLIHLARMHHPFSPNLIRNTSAMFIFLYESKKRRRDLGPLFYTLLDSGLWGEGGRSRLPKRKTSDSIPTAPQVLLFWLESISNAVRKCHLVVNSKLTWLFGKERLKSLSWITKSGGVFFNLFYLNRMSFLYLPSFLKDLFLPSVSLWLW